MICHSLKYNVSLLILSRIWSDFCHVSLSCDLVMLPLVADIIKMTNLPTFSSQKTDMLIVFSVVGLAKNTLWVMNWSEFWLIFLTLKIEK